MLRVVGIPVSDDDVRWLVSALYRDAKADAVHAALEMIRGQLMRDSRFAS